MSYQALYRKYRPVDFNGIVGQPVLVQTLKNAVTTGHITHAYLFSGPRGTGKTSTSRVFAKSINCHFAQDGEPCNECETCQGINNGTLADYVEIDAASNNGVDEIRNIRSQIKYAPLVADYKIYVIDEAHMLSLGAFNALLKTLEEPPAYAVFILATTNPQKIPATIISRLQKYDFHRLSDEEITEQLSSILKQENVTYEEDALKMIAQLANGGMRDALSILDQAVTLSNGEVTLDLVTNLTGTTKKNLLLAYLRDTYQGEVKKSVDEIEEIIHEGKDLSQFIHDLIVLLKELLLFQNGIVGTTYQADELKDFKEIPSVWVFSAIKILNEQNQLLQKTVYGDLLTEIMTIQLANLAKEPVKQTSVPEKIQHSQPKTPAKIVSEPVSKAEFQPIIEKTVIEKGDFTDHDRLNSVLKQATRTDLNDLLDKWDQLIEQTEGELAAAIKYTKPVAASTEGVIVAFKFPTFVTKLDQHANLREDFTNLLGKKSYGISEDEWPEYRKSYLQTLRKGQASPPVQKTEELNNESELSPNMEAIIKFLGKENVKIIDD
ncbi:DNA polymerase III subunit gamma/tau [Xylocopilactobacillus apicola]|uniref:DNA-directed DNA polymerase n=1 Tax=Xylocopilactobacillus apicola TaxID=2932184 RepID=A0AAU9DTN4_9LACO|nr:DNA polymerase III subunit gamma/tau [Xylocopilactobacillus apicola]BDR58778.1 DNA polymerase III subunit gamma/tau [Xylocopilactobacillus apicola]